MDCYLCLDDFVRCINHIINLSDQLMDGWQLKEKEGIENGKYLTKRCTRSLQKTGDASITFFTFEYHVVYHLSYAVPVLCLKIWKQDGAVLSLEEYWELNSNLKDSNMYDTLTQLDHPVLCQPFLTLHPCKTQEVIKPFLEHSKNPVISWLTVVGPFVHMDLLDEYLKIC